MNDCPHDCKNSTECADRNFDCYNNQEPQVLRDYLKLMGCYKEPPPAPKAPEVKDTNPKDTVGATKLPLHLVPETLDVFAAMAFAEGASKYGAFNWRVAGVRASIYYSALRRHLIKWWSGEECDPATKVPHLASAAACIAVLIDASVADKLNDDRPPAVPAAALIDQAVPLLAEINAMYAHVKPHHYTHRDQNEV